MRTTILVYEWQIALCGWMLDLTSRRLKMFENDFEEDFEFIRHWYQGLQDALVPAADPA